MKATTPIFMVVLLDAATVSAQDSIGGGSARLADELADLGRPDMAKKPERLSRSN